ncbi:NusA-like transcription termination signal-binding factor [Candidatus Woesearchaeota archaeon]|nr:MAG: hypothetical protein B6U93_00310 [Candidatus Woesearchaeota archaeon ex4484_78]RLE47018.1 MAG: NusA-like transcription termination signal-binding factor [Candidatus Woesearchaeota archaeon]
MNKIIYDSNTVFFMRLFDLITKAKLKDCIITENMAVYIVEEGETGKAVGKGGINVRTLEKKTKRKIKIAEFSPEILKFIKNLVAPVQLINAEKEDGIITLTAKDLKSRGLLIGRNGTNLRFFESIIKRYFPEIKEIKVK